MIELWNQIREEATHLVGDPRDQARLANLVIAVGLARRSGHLPPLTDKNDGTSLRKAVGRIALHPLPTLGEGKREWAKLSVLAARAATQHASPARLDAWVATFQEADPARKLRGAYATPTPLAQELVRAALAPLRGGVVRVVDPAAGCGALLLASMRMLRSSHTEHQRIEQAHSVYGVEVDPQARELCCLLVWLAAPHGADLGRISGNILTDNALTRDWWTGGEIGFDALVMNPPWESLRDRDSLSGTDAVREMTLERLASQSAGAVGLPPLFTAQGTGDRNLYKAFLELAPHLLRDGARMGALVPAAFASDLGTTELRHFFRTRFALDQWTSFENTQGLFPIDGRYKFGFLIGTRTDEGTTSLRVRSFATEPKDCRTRHVTLNREELDLVGGGIGMIPEVESRSRMLILVRALRSGSKFFEPGPLGSVYYQREVDLTLDRTKGFFVRLEDRPDLQPQMDGTYLDDKGAVWAPLVEGRMVGNYDFYQKTWVSGSGRTAVWEMNGHRPLSACQPQFVAPARVPADARNRVAICDVTAATNTRTVLATWVPPNWYCGNTAPVLSFDSDEFAFAAVAVLNSMVFDWLARRVVAGLHLNKFYLASLVWPRLDPDAVARLARAGAVLCSANPRFAGMPEEWAMTECTFGADPVLIRAGIEHEVARGYSLSPRMLTEIYDADPADRRGFWRYFGGDPAAVRVAEAAISLSRHGAPAALG